MTKYYTYRDTGEIVGSGDCPESMVGLQADPEKGIYAAIGEASWSADYLDGGVLTKKPHRPTKYHVFNYGTKQWIDPRTLAELQAARRAYINASRLAANQTYFTHEGKQIAADALSRGDIDGINGQVANTGDFPAGWPGAWKCLDNTWLPVTTIAQWKALYTSMVNQGTANFAHAQALKGQIDATTAPEQVAAVVW